MISVNVLDTKIIWLLPIFLQIYISYFTKSIISYFLLVLVSLITIILYVYTDIIVDEAIKKNKIVKSEEFLKKFFSKKYTKLLSFSFILLFLISIIYIGFIPKDILGYSLFVLSIFAFIYLYAGLILKFGFKKLIEFTGTKLNFDVK